jgi:hypothetical protein
MKAIKIIFGTILSVLTLVLLLGLFAPNANHMEREIIIDAPLEIVQARVLSFEGMLTWSPWADKDPNQTVTIENDGSVGAVYTWDGVDSLVGAGSQTITALSEKEVVTHLHFTRPFEAEADATTQLESLNDGKILVKWIYDDYAPYPWNTMNLFIDMESMLAPDFELGLQRLKTLAEQDA